MGKKKLDPVLTFFAVVIAAGGLWGLFAGSIYVPSRYGGTSYSEPGSICISIALLIMGAGLSFSGRRKKLHKFVWIAIGVISLLLMVAGTVIGPTVHH